MVFNSFHIFSARDADLRSSLLLRQLVFVKQIECFVGEVTLEFVAGTASFHAEG